MKIIFVLDLGNPTIEEVVTYESRDRIALIRINRPAQRNVANADVTRRLYVPDS